MIPYEINFDTFGQEKGYLCLWKPLPHKASQAPKKVLKSYLKKLKKKHFFLF
ncbi:hypothetical protein HMPREF3224_02115 [Anaerococcus hydrogenalis]|nr:hypothetical protein HMPREF3224_02115 [Anaerococcus hydrogenalis]